jgi:hypothetical protein
MAVRTNWNHSLESLDVRECIFKFHDMAVKAVLKIEHSDSDLDPRFELCCVKGFSHIIVGAGIEGLDEPSFVFK